MSEPQRVIAVVRDYGSLLKGLRARVAELGITFDTLDEAAFMADGHSSKILAPHPTKIIGPSTLPALLTGTATMLLLVEDADVMARIGDLLTPRAKAPMYAGKAMLARRSNKRRALYAFKASPDLAKMARAQQIVGQTAKQRSAIARKAAKARWAKVRRVKGSDTPA